MPQVFLYQVFLAFVISFVSILIITYIAGGILRRRKLGKFQDIIRNDDWYPSLSILQFLVWTFVITFAFLGIYLVRIFGGVLDPPTTSIPANLLTLMGISVSVTVGSGGISVIKYKKERPKERPLPADLKPLSTMLMEENKPTLTRFQMFAWTWISVGIYLVILFSKVADPQMLQNVSNLILPDIDPTLVVLMGISQGAYVGGKLVTSPTMEITTINPLRGPVGQLIQIFGINLGQHKDTVWFGDIAVRKDHPDLIDWNENRIDVKVPSGLGPHIYKIKVAKDGELTSEKDFEVV